MTTRAKLEKENALLRQKESQYKVAIESKDHLIEILKEALILEAHRKFAKASESLRSLQSELFNEAEFESVLEPEIEDTDDGGVEIPAHTRKRGGRKALPAELPRIEVVYDLSDDEKVCDQGHALKQISEKTSEQLDIIPMKIQVIRHIRKQYACPCCEGVLKLASKPKQPIEKSQASSGLLASIAVSKYADSLPLYRQHAILSRFDVDINRSTLANWMIKCGELIQPLINCFDEQILSQPVIHMDETPVQVLNEKGKSAESKSYMWVRHAGPPGQRITLFDYDPSRSGAVPRRLLAGYSGALMLDGYEGYAPVCREQGLTRLGCWVHASRKFVDVSKASKKRIAKRLTRLN
jgi:transposase